MIRLISTATVIALFATIGTARGADPTTPDDEGFIRSWLLLAPLPLAEADREAAGLKKEFIKGEADLKPKAGDKVKYGDQELVWKAYKSDEWFFEFNRAFDKEDNDCAGYAVTYLDVPEELTKLKIKMGSDDQGKIWLNGKEVVAHAGDGRATDKDQDVGENVTLKKGTNVIVFKVINQGGPWGGAIRFTDKEDKPVTKYKVKLTP
jgi:hypothetical protein